MTAPKVNTPRSTKRRTRAEVEVLKEAIYQQLAAEQPATVRHVFYLVANNTKLIAKTEEEYKGTICRLVAEMRLEGQIPWGWIADHTRFMRKPRTWDSVESAIRRTAETYRRSMWDTQPTYVEVWAEKDAISGVVLDVTSPFDVPLMICRGYPSLTFLQDAATNIRQVYRPTVIYYLGDHDPSGHDISRNVEARLREFAPEADITFSRIAVTEEQISQMNLPLRPTKISDSRAKGFTGSSVDIDAIPPTKLRAIVDKAITAHIDMHQWNQLREIEQQERDYMRQLADAGWGRDE